MFNYKSKRWETLSASIMRRDGYKCRLSARYGKNVPAEVVHHIYPTEMFPQYAYCPWNLISLSRSVHNTLHDRNTNDLTDAGYELMRKTPIQ